MNFGESKESRGIFPLPAAPGNPDEDSHADFPNGPLCVGCSVCGYPCIPQYVNLYVSLCPYYRYDILCEDKLLRKYITDITPRCHGIPYPNRSRGFVRNEYEHALVFANFISFGVIRFYESPCEAMAISNVKRERRRGK